MKTPANIFKIIKVTACRFHCWCDSDMGRIKKENKNVSRDLWNKFEEVTSKTKLKWYQRLLFWFKKLWIRLKKKLKK